MDANAVLLKTKKTVTDRYLPQEALAAAVTSAGYFCLIAASFAPYL